MGRPLGHYGTLGGGALLDVDRLGERALVAGLALLPLYRAPLPGPSTPGAAHRGPGSLWSGLASMLGRRLTWIGLGFAALGGAGFEAVGGLAGPLLTDRADGDTTVAGSFYLLPALLAAGAGSLAGGALTDRLGERRGTAVAGVAMAAAVLAVAAAIELRPDATTELLPFLTALYVAIGWFTAASYALFLRWTDPRLGATQFSA